MAQVLLSPSPNSTRSTKGLMHRIVALAFAVCLALPAQKAKSVPSKAAPEPAPVASSEKAILVGSEVCQACHEDIAKGFSRSPHQAVETNKKRGWAGNACESCHGPEIGRASCRERV